MVTPEQPKVFYNQKQNINLETIFQNCVDNKVQIYKRNYKNANPLKNTTSLAELKSLFNPKLLSLTNQALRLHPILPFEHECELLDVE